MRLAWSLATRRSWPDHPLPPLAVAAAKGSRARLFALYMVGIGVTVFLSNDATAVVLTPAVYAAVKKAAAKALPYLFICAFIANAASFVMPISNPANLVVYGKTLPPLMPWLRTFLLLFIGSILATYAVLRWISRGHAILRRTGCLFRHRRSIELGEQLAVGAAGWRGATGVSSVSSHPRRGADRCRSGPESFG